MREIYLVELECESILTNVTSASYQSRWDRVWGVKMKESSMRESRKFLSFCLILPSKLPECTIPLNRLQTPYKCLYLAIGRDLVTRLLYTVQFKTVT